MRPPHRRIVSSETGRRPHMALPNRNHDEDGMLAVERPGKQRKEGRRTNGNNSWR